MAKVILLLIIGFFIYALFRGFFRSQVRQDEDEAARPAATTARGEDMVTCARCGVNLPRSESKEENGRLVCAANPGCKPGA
jgi:formylmethanofuran dehydrogenase subunit E